MSKRFRSTVIVVLALSFLLMTYGTVLAAGAAWDDPVIPGTSLHVWVPEGAQVKIKTKQHDDEVKFRVTVRYECDTGTYEAGINESDDKPGNWLWHDTAECGKKIKFDGKVELSGDNDDDGDHDEGHDSDD